MLPDDLQDDEELSPGELDARTKALSAQVAARTGIECPRCGTLLCGHGALLAIVCGYRHEPHCLPCMAAAMAEAPDAVAERARQWILRRACFRHVWLRASEREGVGADDRPPCHFATWNQPAAHSSPAAVVATTPGDDARPSADASWDAGDLGCGDLVLELRFRLAELPPDGVLAVTARDPAAPVDLPAWCGLCGHSLLHAAHPVYFIRKKRS
jgi:tRNA 2-thiouridine synthesizing protein A